MDVPGQGRPRWAPPPAAAFVACPCPTLGGAVRCPVGGGGSGHPPRVGGGGRRLLPLPSRRAPRPPPPTASLFSWPGLGPPAWRDADAVPSMAPAAAQVATGAAAAAALRWRRPPPVVATRPPLSADLAVGLMRAAYEVLDGMDVVGMDDFQRTFWLLRSDEWARYRAENVGVTQGVLTDVRYFDFISTCQFAAITGTGPCLVVGVSWCSPLVLFVCAGLGWNGLWRPHTRSREPLPWRVDAFFSPPPPPRVVMVVGWLAGRVVAAGASQQHRAVERKVQRGGRHARDSPTARLRRPDGAGNGLPPPPGRPPCRPPLLPPNAAAGPRHAHHPPLYSVGGTRRADRRRLCRLVRRPPRRRRPVGGDPVGDARHPMGGGLRGGPWGYRPPLRRAGRAGAGARSGARHRPRAGAAGRLEPVPRVHARRVEGNRLVGVGEGGPGQEEEDCSTRPGSTRPVRMCEAYCIISRLLPALRGAAETPRARWGGAFPPARPGRPTRPGGVPSRAVRQGAPRSSCTNPTGCPHVRARGVWGAHEGRDRATSGCRRSRHGGGPAPPQAPGGGPRGPLAGRRRHKRRRVLAPHRC
ncbi:hypothetical protein I4F81_002457 [Pyropia yezoensis]|uniref:Uncharacterized protein n=1 Tax=Pyropia yezoensis TaxID=2788 RepID=A0ACC3BPG4_PYRYE|nr:hypothetical protein I4F81_002457 [Neopyropia yezoensis]